MNVSEKLVERILQTCDEIKKDIGTINVTLAVNTNSLQEHMRRTIALEKRIPPIESVTNKVRFVIKAIPWVLGIGVAVSSIVAAVIYKTHISIF